jgi:hypothetical protein
MPTPTDLERHRKYELKLKRKANHKARNPYKKRKQK